MLKLSHRISHRLTKSTSADEVREKKINKSQMKNYIGYAIGEIFLVVIGILIALQSNNWNENRLEREKEVELLHALHSEFTYNIRELEKTMEKNVLVRSELRDFLRYSGPKYEQITKSGFATLLRGITLHSVSYAPGVGVIKDILNSGQLNILTNAELRRMLATWESYLEQVSYQESTVENYRERIKDISMKYGNLTDYFIHIGFAELNNLDFGPHRFSMDGRDLLTNQELTNTILLRYASAGNQQNQYEILKTEIEKILKLIERQLKI